MFTIIVSISSIRALIRESVILRTVQINVHNAP